MYTFIATLVYSAGYHYDPVRSWQKMDACAIGFVLMPRSRFNEILELDLALGVDQQGED